MPQRRFRWRYAIAIVLAGLTALVLSAVEPDLTRDELAHWQDAASRFVNANGADVHYRREGNPAGPTLVLLHGTGASLHTWDAWVDLLGDDYDLLRFDLPGFGLTGPHPDNDYSIAAYVALVDAVAGALGVERFSLAGNSLGGNIAWQYALAHPQKLQALVLIDASGFPSTGERPLVFRVAAIPVVNKLFTLFAPRGFVENSLVDVYADDSLVTPELIRRYHELALYEGNRGAFVQRALQIESAPVGRLGEIAVPTLIQWGEQDTWIPVSDAARFAAALPDASVIVYPDTGHVPMEENPVKNWVRPWASATRTSGSSPRPPACRRCRARQARARRPASRASRNHRSCSAP